MKSSISTLWFDIHLRSSWNACSFVC